MTVKKPMEFKHAVYISAAFMIFSGSVFLILYPKKMARDKLDLDRLVQSELQQSALEQYVLMRARTRIGASNISPTLNNAP